MPAGSKPRCGLAASVPNRGRRSLWTSTGSATRLDGVDAAHRHDNGARKIAAGRDSNTVAIPIRQASVRAGENRVAGVGSPVAHFCSDRSPLKSSSVGVVTAPATMRKSRPKGSEPENQPESVIDRA